ncbi:MAG TPA: HAD family hydrolase [Armatimonadota bacterium]
MKNTLPRAILLDMDDTLLDFTGSTFECWQSVCREYEHRFNGIDAAHLQQAIENYAKWYWSDADRHREGRLVLLETRRGIVHKALLGLGIDDAETAGEMGDKFSAKRDSHLCLFPDTLSELQRLLSMEIRLGLVTNGPSEMQRDKIERFGLESYFDFIAIEGEVGAGKPDSRIFRHILSGMNTDPNEAWMVGDNLQWDVFGPQQVGMQGIWYNRSRIELPADSGVKPDRVISRLGELPY